MLFNLVQVDVCANILTQILQGTDKCIGALIDEFISQEISNQFWHTIMFRRLFFLATTTAGRAVPHLLHDLVNFIADIQQLHATRGRRFGHQSIQLIAEIH
ncbi:Uncharacterised protein [Salmonella enterica subsp. enterica serovar Typhi]|nr:Uncharacterised protein [Salmonella enterica subsp. enterica serovar Typhi]CQW00967.1 Uncharacterised protein [Salmonella enterica subsp. enterica serovar Typhi]